MTVRAIWQRVRKIVPVHLYPLLAPVYRWDRRRQLQRLGAQDLHYRREHPNTLAPGAELRFNVVGPVTIPEFLAGGRRSAEEIEFALNQANSSMKEVRTALDFGCGCGRLLMEAMNRWPGIQWFGSDVDGRAIDWCAAHLAGAVVVANSELPPLQFRDGQFDLIWCGSVFTHLDERRQDRWLTELCRVLKPGGHLLASVHGRCCWSDLPASTVRIIQQRGFLFARTGADEGIHPGWYQTAWHTPEYVQQHWSHFARILAYLPRALHGYQDIVVMRKPRILQ